MSISNTLAAAATAASLSAADLPEITKGDFPARSEDSGVFKEQVETEELAFQEQLEMSVQNLQLRSLLMTDTADMRLNSIGELGCIQNESAHGALSAIYKKHKAEPQAFSPDEKYAVMELLAGRQDDGLKKDLIATLERRDPAPEKGAAYKAANLLGRHYYKGEARDPEAEAAVKKAISDGLVPGDILTPPKSDFNQLPHQVA